MIKKITKTVFFASAAMLFFLFSPSVFAQKEAKAREYLDKSSAVFEKAGPLSIPFTLNIRDVSNQLTESFNGILDVKGTKFRLNVPGNEIWFDGKTQWLLQKDYDEVQITEPSEQEMQIMNPVAILGMYKKNCNYKYRGEKTDENGRKVQEIELFPQVKGNEIKCIMMQISAVDFLPVKIHIFLKNKMENIIHIHKYQKNAAVTDSHFVFNPKDYPDAEIIDLR